MSPGERYDMWHRIHDGVFNVLIGPRSAVFAPVRSLGILIVDEEHDTSYKQTDTSPRYNARDVAVVRGKMLGIPVVLGSATPSLESWHNVSKGKYLLSTLTERVESKPLPKVQIVDMREERTAGNYSSISRLLREELIQRVKKREKSIILINRRGFATSIACKKCGYILTCPNCSVGLTFHSSKGLALCHWCGHEQLVLEHCPECGEAGMIRLGMGTQKIEKELAMITGPGSVVRMDSDTTSMHDGHFKLLEEFIRGDAPVLLGTQMVSKGLDIHDVTLVGIISADQSLFIPDFRAFERTFQLVTQVAGRSGRGTTLGMVILQTFKPDNYAIQAASRQDYETFAMEELRTRKEVNFPPYTRLILIEISSNDPASLKASSEETAAYLSSKTTSGMEVLGPIEAPIAKKRGRHRYHILIKHTRPQKLQLLLHHITDYYSKREEKVTITIDPEEMM
jgi:primosomal protein N' (replication factor Y)